MTSHAMTDVILTMGDPFGIGPEIIVKALHETHVWTGARFTIVGVLQAFERLKGFSDLRQREGFHFVDVDSSQCVFCPENSGRLSVLALEKVVNLLKQGPCQTLVTAPISKGRVKAAGFTFPGHTEFLCAAFNVKRFAMMLFHERLRVVLATIHCPLKDVAKHLTIDSIVDKLALTAETLKGYFGIAKPRIAVCGLNPHAGESGLIGREEMEIIVPAIERFRGTPEARFAVVTGPLSADSVFHRAMSGEFDAVLSQYHDQGLIPIKTTGFFTSLNLTMGLPFVRTSPDHGTAFDIAGKDLADARSMVAAIFAAKEFTNRREETL